MEILSYENDNIEEVLMIAEEVVENGNEIYASDIENVFHQNEQFDEVGGTEEDYIESENSDDENIFSVYQSNILYGLFLLGTILCISGDVCISFLLTYFSQVTFQVGVQFYNNGELANPVKFILLIISVNIILWIDFILTPESINICGSFDGKVQGVHQFCLWFVFCCCYS